MTALRVIEGGAMPAPDVLALGVYHYPIEIEAVLFYHRRAWPERWTPIAWRDLAEHLGVTVPTAREIVNDLVRSGVLACAAGLAIRVRTLREALEVRADRARVQAQGLRRLMDLAHLDPCAPLIAALEPTSSDDDVRSEQPRKAE
ncbi:MAG: hypothetical protein MUE69_31970 [Myxococcota bacterium]|jgi:hypothetical protein|nr:hypothetical protein [Myxococcota bacterium]